MISKCNGEGCDKKYNCRRFNKKPTSYQSYIGPDPVDCDFFINDLSRESFKLDKYDIDKDVFYPLKNYEQYYAINSKGDIMSLRRGKPLKPGKRGSKKYLYVNLRGAKNTSVDVHRLVALQFIPNPFGFKCVNHIDNNQYNNNVENLEWCTQRHNCRDYHSRFWGKK